MLTAELNAMGVSPGCSPAGTLSHDVTAGSPEASRRAGRRMRADMAFFFIVLIVCLLLLLAVAVLQFVRLHWGVSLSSRAVRRTAVCEGSGRGVFGGCFRLLPKESGFRQFSLLLPKECRGTFAVCCALWHFPASDSFRRGRVSGRFHYSFRRSEGGCACIGDVTWAHYTGTEPGRQ